MTASLVLLLGRMRVTGVLSSSVSAFSCSLAAERSSLTADLRLGLAECGEDLAGVESCGAEDLVLCGDDVEDTVGEEVAEDL